MWIVVEKNEKVKKSVVNNAKHYPVPFLCLVNKTMVAL